MSDITVTGVQHKVVQPTGIQYMDGVGSGPNWTDMSRAYIEKMYEITLSVNMQRGKIMGTLSKWFKNKSQEKTRYPFAKLRNMSKISLSFACENHMHDSQCQFVSQIYFPRYFQAPDTTVS